MTPPVLAAWPLNPTLQGIVSFHEEDHRYVLGDSTLGTRGVVLPSVTHVLKTNGTSADFDALVASGAVTLAQLTTKREIGRAAHLATVYYDAGTLDPATLDPRVKPYLEGWARFRQETGFRPVPNLTEKVLHDPGYLFAGTVDRVGSFDNGRTFNVVDIKTGDPAHSAVQFQTAAYANLVEKNLLKSAVAFDTLGAFLTQPRYAVRLRSDGGFTRTPHGDFLHDWSSFLAILKAVRLRRSWTVEQLLEE